MALGPIVVRSTLPETRAQVWQMLTSDESRTNWWPETQIVAEMGGRIVESAKSKTVSEEGTDPNEILREGTVDVHVPEQTLGFRWKNLAADNDTNVVILLRPDDENMDHTVITVIESGFAGHPDAAELVETANNRWTGLLNTLEAVVTGEEITSEDSSAQETAEENDAEETTEEENLVQDSTVLEDTAAEDVVAESTGEEGTVAESTGEEGTVAENAVAENATEDSSSSETAESTEEITADGTAAEGTDTDDTEAEDLDSTEPGTEEVADLGFLGEESGAEDLEAEDVDAEAHETLDTEIDSDAEPNAEPISEDIHVEVRQEELAPLILPDIPEEFLQPEPEDDLGENAFTGEVPITISDTGGVAVDDIITEEDIEEGPLTEWEKLLHGESLDND